MTERRELMRQVPRGEAEIKYALRWAEAVLREWHMTHEEAVLIVSEPRRNLEQNAKMWCLFQDIASQVVWFVDGQQQKLEKEEWKEILTAGLRKHQRVAAGIEGGFVILGARTSRMTKSEMSDLIELAYEFGCAHSVAWTEPAKKVIDEHRNRKVA